MGDLISKLPISALAIIAFVVASGFVILVLLFVHAYFSGREVALWLPKIGAKKYNGENKIGIDENDIVNHLVKKIRAHQVAFSIPRRAVLLPFMGGEYFGIFSWQNNIIVCHSIFAVPGDADPEMWKLWNDMLFIYNDTYGS